MMSKVPLCVLLGLVCCAHMILECEGQRTGRRRNRNGNQRNADNGMNPSLHRAYVNIVTGGQTTPSAATTVPSSWAHLIPTLPAPDHVECHVEIPHITRHGGRCMRTGGSINRPYFCQSGLHLAPDSDCEAILNGRASNPNN